MSDSQGSVSSAPLPLSKKVKTAKSAAMLVKGKAKGEVKYKPCEIQEGVIAAEHARFEVEPLGNIADYPRHIPYNSEKKSFQQRTGRDAFEGIRGFLSCSPSKTECSLNMHSVPVHIPHAI